MLSFLRNFFLINLFFCTCLGAQPLLPYSINKAVLPQDSDRIVLSTTPFGDESDYFKYSGFQQGDIVPDFVLYDTSGKSTQLSLLLAEGKPVLLIAGSYTCPRTRKGVMEHLDSLRLMYGEKVNIVFIYTLEAHPALPDDCPYQDEAMIAAATRKNRLDLVLYRQPKNYSGRKIMAKRFIRNMHIKVPVLLDSPDNVWWRNFGPAPNNAYLLAPNGMVYRKWAWLETLKTEPIDELLADKSIMHPDPELYPEISKSPKEKNASLHVVQNEKYAISIYNADGKNIFTEGKITTHDYNLDKTAAAPGEYSIVVKVMDGHSYCLKWKK